MSVGGVHSNHTHKERVPGDWQGGTRCLPLGHFCCTRVRRDISVCKSRWGHGGPPRALAVEPRIARMFSGGLIPIARSFSTFRFPREGRLAPAVRRLFAEVHRPAGPAGPAENSTREVQDPLRFGRAIVAEGSCQSSQLNRFDRMSALSLRHGRCKGLFPSDGPGPVCALRKKGRRENLSRYSHRVRSATLLGSVPGRRPQAPCSRCVLAGCRGVRGFLRRSGRHSTRLGGDRLCPR